MIELADGGSISGLVTRFTWIDAGDNEGCDSSHSSRSRRQLHDWCRTQQLHGSEHGDDHGWHHGRSGDTDDLVAGAVVDDALLVLKDGRAFYAGRARGLSYLASSQSAPTPTSTSSGGSSW